VNGTKAPAREGRCSFGLAPCPHFSYPGVQADEPFFGGTPPLIGARSTGVVETPRVRDQRSQT